MYGGEESKFVPFHHLTNVCGTIGSLRNDDDGNENSKKSNRFRQAKQQLCTCVTLFLYISLPSLHDYNVKLPNFTFCRGRGTEDNDFLFPFLNFDAVL